MPGFRPTRSSARRSWATRSGVRGLPCTTPSRAPRSRHTRRSRTGAGASRRPTKADLRFVLHACEHVFVLMEANILHADLDAFFASVHQRDDPALRGRPVAVGGGVVMAASYEAKACGVRSAMGGAAARRLCPDLVVVTPNFDAYVEASKAVFDIFRDTAPYVEGISIDEAFLDVSGLELISGTPPAIAARLRRRVREQVGLAITVG